jgi:deazaflavin-dependent oxidoreductase (nitroreductase family)
MNVAITPNGTRGDKFPEGPLVRFGLRLNAAVFRLFRGRGIVKSLLLLTTVGAKSGERRTVPLAYFPDGDDAWLIVASAGGAARHPAWYYNLAGNPDQVWVEVGDRKVHVTPESLHGAEREEPWRRITGRASNFVGYQEKTDREIPVIRLRATS